MRALVTGAECFIGSHLVDALLDRGINPRLYVLRGSTTSNLPAGRSDLEIVRGDLLSGEGIEEAVEGIDTIFHLAAVTKGYYRSHFVGPNLLFMKNLNSCSHGVWTAGSEIAALFPGSCPGYSPPDRNGRPGVFPDLCSGLG